MAIFLVRAFFKRYRQCPACDSTWIHSSGPMNWRERKLYPRLGLRPYRCDKCSRRYLGLAFQQRLDRPQ